ncbi:MAG: hypothetical protein ACOYLX_10365, partial [Burkholderiaceae bacterium]
GGGASGRDSTPRDSTAPGRTGAVWTDGGSGTAAGAGAAAAGGAAGIGGAAAGRAPAGVVRCTIGAGPPLAQAATITTSAMATNLLPHRNEEVDRSRTMFARTARGRSAGATS